MTNKNKSNNNKCWQNLLKTGKHKIKYHQNHNNHLNHSKMNVVDKVVQFVYGICIMKKWINMKRIYNFGKVIMEVYLLIILKVLTKRLKR